MVHIQQKKKNASKEGKRTNTQATELEPRNIKRKPLLVTIPLLFTGFFYVYIDIDVNWNEKTNSADE